MAEVAFAVTMSAVFLTGFTRGVGGGRWAVIRTVPPKAALNGGNFGSDKAGICTWDVPAQSVKEGNDFQLERKERIVRKTVIVAGTEGFPGINLGRQKATPFDANLADLVEVVE
ncbi:hypothetical protein BC829DRAFT_423862 [Chytridium lagenaria]|nr:hypothetical protein BC829DRAFT_423862 [Chytridium lagenaria]